MAVDINIQKKFLNLYQMAISDSNFAVEELSLLYKIGEEQGITPEQMEDIIIHPDNSSYYVPESIAEKIESLYNLARIANADGRIDDNEVQMLKSFCLRYGFLEENVSGIIDFLLEEARKGTLFPEVLDVVNKNL